HHRYASDLAHERHCSGGARVDLEHVESSAMDDVLNIDQTSSAYSQGDARGVVDDGFDLCREEPDARVDREGVTRMHAGAFDMLHDAGNEDVGSVANRIDFDLFAEQVL